MAYKPKTKIQARVCPDRKWEQMKDVWDSCKQAGVEVPSEVGEYFGWKEPDDTGVLIDIEPGRCEYTGPLLCTREHINHDTVYTLFLPALPKAAEFVSIVIPDKKDEL